MKKSKVTLATIEADEQVRLQSKIPNDERENRQAYAKYLASGEFEFDFFCNIPPEDRGEVWDGYDD